MKTLFRVLAQTEPVAVPARDGSQIQKCTIILQEVGSRYEDSYVVTLLGSLATCVWHPGTVVWASLRFQARQFNPKVNGVTDTSKVDYLMDITAQDIICMDRHNSSF